MENRLPSKIKAGLTFDRLVSLPAFPAGEWALQLVMRGPGVINLAAVASGEQHRFRVPAADSTPWTAGRYAYSLRATRGGDVEEVETGEIEVVADLAAMPAGTDTRSQNRRTLDAICAVIENRASQDQQKYTIKDRELWRTPIADLLKLRATYAVLVRAEESRRLGRNLWGPAAQVHA